MSRAGDVDHIEIVLLDHPVQVSVNKVQARRRPPMTEKPRLDVFFRERLLEQWVVIEIDLTDRKIVGCSASIETRSLTDNAFAIIAS